MSILDQVMYMKKQGMPEQEIVRSLQEQGISPRAITEAVNQSKVKEAVGGEMEENQEFFNPEQISPPENYQPSSQEIYPEPAQGQYYPYQEQYAPQEQYPAQTEYAPQEGYEGYYEGGTAMNTDLIIEVAEQVFEEKTKKIEKQLENLKEFSVLADAKLANFEDRIKRIESIIENLQIKILEKIGSYGQGIESIRKEMGMMQDSFSKMIPEFARPSSKHEFQGELEEPKEYEKEMEEEIKKHTEKNRPKKRIFRR